MAKPPIWDRRATYKSPSQARSEYLAISFRRLDADWKARQLWERGGGAWLMVATAHVVAAVYHHFYAEILGYDARWTNEPLVILGAALAIIAVAMYRLTLVISHVWLPIFCLVWIALGFVHNLVTGVSDKISMGIALMAIVMAIGAIRAALYMDRQSRLEGAESTV